MMHTNQEIAAKPGAFRLSLCTLRRWAPACGFEERYPLVVKAPQANRGVDGVLRDILRTFPPGRAATTVT